MSETKWTPGPYERVGQRIYALEDAGHRMKTNRFYAHVDRSGSQATPEELEAIAQLWVAAPELYEALALLTDVARIRAGNVDKVFAEPLAKADAALSRARGEAS